MSAECECYRISDSDSTDGAATRQRNRRSVSILLFEARQSATRVCGALTNNPFDNRAKAQPRHSSYPNWLSKLGWTVRRLRRQRHSPKDATRFSSFCELISQRDPYYVKDLFCHPNQITISQTVPSHFLGRFDVVTGKLLRSGRGTQVSNRTLTRRVPAFGCGHTPKRRSLVHV